MAIEIRPVTTDEVESIYRFRYNVYVEEMNRTQFYADHTSRTIRDPLDDSAVVLAAWDGQAVVGTVRYNFLRHSGIGEYFELYNVAGIPPLLRENTSITTRLMVAPRFRGGTLASRLACAAYKDALVNGIQVDLIDCNHHLISFFSRLGYLTHRDGAVHAEYGPVTVMRLNLLDQEHLSRVRSPFRTQLLEHLARQARPACSRCQRIRPCLQIISREVTNSGCDRNSFTAIR